MWMPAFGHIPWPHESVSPELISVSKKDKSIRLYEVVFSIEEPILRERENSEYTISSPKVPKVQTEIHTIDGKEKEIKLFIQLERNDKGNLARIACRIDATNEIDALEYSYNSISYLLSFETLVAGAPLSIWGMSVLDTKHRAAWVVIPQRVSSEEFGFPAALALDDRFKAVMSLYREGRGSTSPFYRFFCFYKIIEGAFESHETGFLAAGTRMIKKHKAEHPKIRRQKNRITNEMLLFALVDPNMKKELEGKTFGEFWHWVRSNHRNLVAHTFPRDYTEEQWLNLDNFTIRQEFTAVGNLCDQIASTLIKSELDLWLKIQELCLIDFPPDPVA